MKRKNTRSTGKTLGVTPLTATRHYSRSSVLSWNRLWRHNQSRLLEEECSSDRLRKFDSRRNVRWWQRWTLRDPWKLLQP